MRTRHRRMLLGSILSLVIVVSGSAAVVRQRTDLAWSAMQKQIHAIDAAWQLRDHRRLPLYGEGTDGRAFDGYEQAIELAKPLCKGSNRELIATLPHKNDAKVEGTEALRERWRPAIDALRAASRCNDARPPQTSADAPETGVLSLLDARWLVNMTVLEARALRLAGKPREAVERTLDAATFGADLMQSGLLINTMIGAAVVAIAIDEAWPEDALSKLDGPSLDLLAESLDRLDRRLPSFTDLDGELRFIGHWLQSRPVEENKDFSTSSWRFGFSPKWMAADAYLHFAAAGERIVDGPNLSWPQRKAWLELEINQMLASGNPITAMMVPNLMSSENTLREVQTRVRLVRMAVAAHRGINSHPLQDPLGAGPFAVAKEGDRVTFRSAGTRGEKAIERSVQQ
jgi:hypothetical protein